MLKEECINFPRSEVADQLLFLFDDLAISLTNYIDIYFNLRKSCLFNDTSICTRAVPVSVDTGTKTIK